MPNYEYECENCGRFEVFQKMSDKKLETCPKCGSCVERVITSFAMSFAGSGFYVNDSKPATPSTSAGSQTSKPETGGASGGGAASTSSSAGSSTSGSACSGKSCTSCSGCK